MSQLSLFSEAPTWKIATVTQRSEVKYYCDVFVETWWDEKRNRIRLRPIAHQPVEIGLNVSCSHRARKHFPLGTIFKLDLRLTQAKTKRKMRGKAYLIARAGVPLVRAIEFFDQNIHLQKSAVTP